MPRVLAMKSVTIPSQTAISNSVDISAISSVVGIVMPAAWTPAVITVQGSADGINFNDMYSGMPVTLLQFNTQPSVIVSLDPNRLQCCMAIKLRSGTPAAPVIQAATRTFAIVCEN